MLHGGGGVLHLDVGEGVGAAAVAHQHGVADAVVAGVVGAFVDLHQAAVGVLPFHGADALAHDGAAGVFADVDHLGARVGLLLFAGERNAVELAHAVVALQDDAGVLPGDGAAGLDLGPGDGGVVALALAALGDEVEDPALALAVAGIPVLHGGVLDGGVGFGVELNHGRVELVLVAHRRGAPFQVAHIAAFFHDNEGPLKLAGVHGVDAEVGAQLHGAAHALGHIDKAAVAEDGAVQRRIVVVAVGHHGAQILLDELGVVVDGFADAAEDDAMLGELLLEAGEDRDGVENGVDGHVGQHLLLLQRDAELFVGRQDFGVNFVQAVQLGLLLGGRVVAERLQVHGRVMHVGPLRLLQGQKVAVRLEAELEHPLRLLLFGAEGAHDVFAEARLKLVDFDVGGEAPLVFLRCGIGQHRVVFAHLLRSIEQLFGLGGARHHLSLSLRGGAGKVDSLVMLGWTMALGAKAPGGKTGLYAQSPAPAAILPGPTAGSRGE